MNSHCIKQNGKLRKTNEIKRVHTKMLAFFVGFMNVSLFNNVNGDGTSVSERPTVRNAQTPSSRFLPTLNVSALTFPLFQQSGVRVNGHTDLFFFDYYRLHFCRQ